MRKFNFISFIILLLLAIPSVWLSRYIKQGSVLYVLLIWVVAFLWWFIISKIAYRMEDKESKEDRLYDLEQDNKYLKIDLDYYKNLYKNIMSSNRMKFLKTYVYDIDKVEHKFLPFTAEDLGVIEIDKKKKNIIIEFRMSRKNNKYAQALLLCEDCEYTREDVDGKDPFLTFWIEEDDGRFVILTSKEYKAIKILCNKMTILEFQKVDELKSLNFQITEVNEK